MSTGVTTADFEHEHAPADAQADRERQETLSVATTSIAAVATAWAAFEAATWSGRQTFAIAEATKLRQLSSEAQLQGDQRVHLDVNLFVAWASAYADHNELLAQFLYDRFPARLKTATDAWIQTQPLKSKTAPSDPFAMPEYKVESHDRAIALGGEADVQLAHGRSANRTSDGYVLYTVVFATIMLLASVAVRFTRPGPRRALLVVSCVGLVVALAFLVLRPIAWPGV